MSECYRENVVKYCKSQKGYTEGKNNYNKYAKELDSVNYFYPQKKQYEAWCCIYVDDCFFNACGKDKAKTYKVLYQPSKNNYSAVVTCLANYFKNHKAYYTDSKKITAGDVVFFNAVNSKGKVTNIYTHTGIVISVSSTGFKTSEGNKNNKVSECSYTFKQIGSKVAGFGKPKFDTKPTPTPTPTPTPKPTSNKYKVKTNSGVALRLRLKRSTSSKQVGWVDNGETVKVTDIKNGWGLVDRSGAKGGGSTKGYGYMSYLKKI